jgi:dTDP-4-amino-4,6-dideoxygalactose transaminase
VGLPHAEQAAASVVSLPMFPMLTDAQIRRVCDVVLTAV